MHIKHLFSSFLTFKVHGCCKADGWAGGSHELALSSTHLPVVIPKENGAGIIRVLGVDLRITEVKKLALSPEFSVGSRSFRIPWWHRW